MCKTSPSINDRLFCIPLFGGPCCSMTIMNGAKLGLIDGLSQYDNGYLWVDCAIKMVMHQKRMALLRIRKLIRDCAGADSDVQSQNLTKCL